MPNVAVPAPLAKPPRISPKHARALGYVVASWSEIEEVVAHVASMLLDLFDSAGGAAVWAELSGEARFKLARILLAETRIQEWLDDWDDIEPTFSDLRNRRNDAVHAVWNVVGNKHWAFRIRAKKSVIVELEQHSTEKLVKLDREIDALLDRLISFTVKIYPDAAKALKDAPQRAALVPSQGRRALARDQARAAKRAQKTANRERDRKPPT